jgi:hypothetical protein
VDAGSGEPVDKGLDPEMPEIRQSLGFVGQAPVMYQGSTEFEMGPRNTYTWKNLQTDAHGRWTPVEPPEEPVVSPSRPSLYEVRRDALTAASNLTSSGGWMDPGNKTLEFAEKFEKYLLEVRDK